MSKNALQYRGNSQHDAQEFLLWLLDRVHEDLNHAVLQSGQPPVKVRAQAPGRQGAGPSGPSGGGAPGRQGAGQSGPPGGGAVGAVGGRGSRGPAPGGGVGDRPRFFSHPSFSHTSSQAAMQVACSSDSDVD